jgi:hypothetical protein
LKIVKKERAYLIYPVKEFAIARTIIKGRGGQCRARGPFLARQDFFKMLILNKGPARVFSPQK